MLGLHLTKCAFSVQYPQDWELDDSGKMGTSFILFSAVASDKDSFRENVNLIIQDLTSLNLDLDKYVEISESQIKTMITDGKIMKSERITSGANQYHKVIYTGKQGDRKLQFEQYYWVINNEAYVLTLTCEKSQFSAYQEVGERILNSFQIK